MAHPSLGFAQPGPEATAVEETAAEETETVGTEQPNPTLDPSADVAATATNETEVVSVPAENGENTPTPLGPVRDQADHETVNVVNPFATRVVETEQDPERLETVPEQVPERAPRVSIEPRPPEQNGPALWHVVGQLGVGLGLRLNVQEEFEQTAMAPFYFSAAGGVLLPTTGPLRFEARLAISANLSRDGTFSAGTPALSQWLITPSFGVRYRLSGRAVPTWVLTGRVGLPIAVGRDMSVGAELAGGVSYNLLAGLGIYGEIIYDLFAGGRVRDGSRTIHHLMALEIGARIDFEVLP